jgi:hypothetical protein
MPRPIYNEIKHPKKTAQHYAFDKFALPPSEFKKRLLGITEDEINDLHPDVLAATETIQATIQILAIVHGWQGHRELETLPISAENDPITVQQSYTMLNHLIERTVPMMLRHNELSPTAKTNIDIEKLEVLITQAKQHAQEYACTCMQEMAATLKAHGFVKPAYELDRYAQVEYTPTMKAEQFLRNSQEKTLSSEKAFAAFETGVLIPMRHYPMSA